VAPDNIISSSIEHAGNRGPFVLVLGVGSHYSGIHFRSEGEMINLGTHLVTPSKSAQRSRSSLDHFVD